MLGNIVKCFEWPLVRKARYECSPFTNRCVPQVDLKFPQSGSPDPNLVTVTGRPELVDEAIDHLLNLEEEYVRPASLPSPQSTRLWGASLCVGRSVHLTAGTVPVCSIIIVASMTSD